jgi:hypothetical protein
MIAFLLIALPTCATGVAADDAPSVRHDEHIGEAAPHAAVRYIDDASIIEKAAAEVFMDPYLLTCLFLLFAVAVFNRTLPPTKTTEQPSVMASPPIVHKKEKTNKWEPRRQSRLIDRLHTESDDYGHRAAAAGFAPLNSLRSVGDVLASVDSQLDRMNIQRIGAVCNRIGKLGRKSDSEYASSPVVVRLLGRLEQLVEAEPDADLRCRAVAAAVWALAKIGYSGAAETDAGRGPLATLKKQFIENIKNFRVEETTNTIWALSELRRRCDICVLEVGVAACACKDAWAEYSDEELIFLIWASARVLALNHVRSDTRVADGIEHLLKLTSDRFGSIEKVANVCPKFGVMLSWALTQFGGTGTESVFAALAESASTALESYSISEVTALLWALTKNGKFDSPLFEKYKARCVELEFEGLNSQDIANAVCIFARREVCDDAFLKMLHEATEARKVRFNQTEERMMGWARKQRPRAFANQGTKGAHGSQSAKGVRGVAQPGKGFQ